MNPLGLELKKETKKLVDQLVHSDEAVKRWLKKSRVIDSMTRLPGDASTRRYYRIKSKRKTLILMKREPFTKQANHLPFLEVREHLSKCGIDVPEVFDADAKKGTILLEDLGDTTLLHHLGTVVDVEIERHIYQKVIDGLVHLHFNASQKPPKSKMDAFKLRFDHEKLMWEVQYTVENFYELHLDRKIKPRDQKIIQSQFSSICKTLAVEPTVFTHRDFHSRNVMVVPKKARRTAAKKTKITSAPSDLRFVMIDFQDARLGPKQYDLASLLRDSYYQLSENQIRLLMDYYVNRWEALSDEHIDRDHFERIFDLMSLQRNFKAIGSFASFLSKRGNATYLKYIGNTFENIRKTLLKYPEYSDLREVLFHYYYF